MDGAETSFFALKGVDGWFPRDPAFPQKEQIDLLCTVVWKQEKKQHHKSKLVCLLFIVVFFVLTTWASTQTAQLQFILDFGHGP